MSNTFLHPTGEMLIVHRVIALILSYRWLHALYLFMSGIVTGSDGVGFAPTFPG